MRKKAKSINGKSLYNNLYLEDKATSLYNKNYFKVNINNFAIQMIKGLIQNTKNGNDKTTWSIMFCDIDGLKFANDMLGHIVADEGIKKIADIIKNCIRTNREQQDQIIYNKKEVKNNIPIRFGGDEFIIFLPNCTKEKAKLIEERIKLLVNKNIKDTKNMTLSIGIADTTEVNVPTQIDDTDALNTFVNQLITLAEQRMYEDKNKDLKYLSYEEKKIALMKHLARVGENIGLNINQNENIDLLIEILNEMKEINTHKKKR